MKLKAIDNNMRLSPFIALGMSYDVLTEVVPFNFKRVPCNVLLELELFFMDAFIYFCE